MTPAVALEEKKGREPLLHLPQQPRNIISAVNSIQNTVEPVYESELKRVNLRQEEEEGEEEL